MVVREATCVRFGPTRACIMGTPRMVWHAMHMPVVTSFCPFAAFPLANTLSSKASFDGNGVCGMACGGSFPRGYAMKPACVTGVGCGAAAGTPAPGALAAGVDGARAGAAFVGAGRFAAVL